MILQDVGLYNVDIGEFQEIFNNFFPRWKPISINLHTVYAFERCAYKGIVNTVFPLNIKDETDSSVG